VGLEDKIDKSRRIHARNEEHESHLRRNEVDTKRRAQLLFAKKLRELRDYMRKNGYPVVTIGKLEGGARTWYGGQKDLPVRGWHIDGYRLSVDGKLYSSNQYGRLSEKSAELRPYGARSFYYEDEKDAIFIEASDLNGPKDGDYHYVVMSFDDYFASRVALIR